MNNWDSIVTDLKSRAQAMHEGREAGLVKCRALTQTSAKCIRHIHRKQFDQAEALLAEAVAISASAREALTPFPELYHAGYLQDAERRRWWRQRRWWPL